MSIWSDDSIALSKEESGRLRYELAHPDPEAMAKRDAFFASFEDKIHISWEPFEMVCEIPELSRELLESLDQSALECSVDLQAPMSVEYEMVEDAIVRKPMALHDLRRYQARKTEFYSSVKKNFATGYRSEKENAYMECRTEKKISRCA